MAEPFLPPIPSPFRLTVGLRRIEPERWIEADAGYGADLVARERVLEEHFADAVQTASGDAATRATGELLSTLGAALAADASGTWSVHDDGTITVVPTGRRVDVVRGDAMTAAAHLVADDLCVLGADDHVLLAGAVCFPNRWRLSDKLGRPVAEIHGPVPGYAEELDGRVTQVLAKLRPGTVLERRNWSLLDDPALFQPKGPEPGAAPSRALLADPGEHTWVRVERQTLRRLPETGAVVFTIRTLQRRLRELEPHEARPLAIALRQLPEPMTAYKDLVSRREPVLAWLDAAHPTP
jgi:dimethylamine monooxygenase subunit A